MTHRHLIQLAARWVITVLAIAPSAVSTSLADDVKDSSQAILRIDDTDLEEGELRLLLQDSGFAEGATLAPRQASAAVLVRQHLAMKSLLSLGGKPIQAIIDRELNLVSKQLESSGSSFAKAASDRGVSPRAYQRHLTWQIAWREYLKSRVTDTALKSYFESHQDQYGGREYLVSQIFIRNEPTNKSDKDSAVSTLEDIAKSVRRSLDVASDFALAARQHSDAASANQGGDIGWVRLDGDLPGTVMIAVRKAMIGEVVGPISSPLGKHLILVREHRDSEITWNSVTDQSQLRRDFARDLFLDLVRRQNSTEVRYLDETLQPKFR